MVGTDLQEALRAITSDSMARRELLWLGAMEQEDEAEARRLERIEAGLGEHMQKLVGQHFGRCQPAAVARGAAGEPLGDAPVGGRSGYAKLFNERWAYHATRLTGRPHKQCW